MLIIGGRWQRAQVGEAVVVGVGEAGVGEAAPAEVGMHNVAMAGICPTAIIHAYVSLKVYVTNIVSCCFHFFITGTTHPLQYGQPM